MKFQSKCKIFLYENPSENIIAKWRLFCPGGDELIRAKQSAFNSCAHFVRHAVHNQHGPLHQHGLALIPVRINRDIYYKMWNENIYPFSTRKLNIDKSFHPTVYWTCHHLSMLRLKLIKDSKKGPGFFTATRLQCRFIVTPVRLWCTWSPTEQEVNKNHAMSIDSHLCVSRGLIHRGCTAN